MAHTEPASDLLSRSRKQGPSRLTLYSIIVAASTAITLTTGLLLWARVVFPNPTAANYGLPLPWRSMLQYYSQNATTDWNVGIFSLDIAFYAAIGYIMAFPYQRRYRTMRKESPALGLSIAYVLLVLFISISLYTSYCDPVSRTCG